MPTDAILDFFRSEICIGPNGHEGRTASSSQISVKSLKLWPRYGDFSIFQNGGSRHVKFLNYKVLTVRTHHKCRIASPCQISWSERSSGWNCISMPNFVDIAQKAAEIIMAIFQFFKMATTAILDL